MEVTHDQAKEAISFILGIIDEAFPNNTKYKATQINIHPSVTKQLYDLVQEIKEQQSEKI